MKQKSWQEGHAHAFEEFGGVAAHVGARQRHQGDEPRQRPARHAREQGIRALRRSLSRGHRARPGSPAARQERCRIMRLPGGTLNSRPLQRDDILHSGGVQRVLRGEGRLAKYRKWEES